MKRIVINGPNSFIGKNFYNRYKKKLNIYYYKNDINDLTYFKKYLKKKKFQYFVHFAGLSRLKCSNNKKLCLKTNFLAIKNKIDFFNTLKNKPLFIFISSSHVYDYSKKKIRENFPKKPKDLYGKLKLKSENYIKNNYRKYCILRLFNVYGAKQPKSYFVSDISEKINNNQLIHIDKSVRDFLNVNEVVRVIYSVIKKDVRGTLNVGSGFGISLKSVVKKIAVKLKKKPIIKISNHSSKLVASISLLNLHGIKIKKNEKNFNI
tara:strand:- start:180 stop:968 length:789 start_codon:yes stop_codon:yes gene_type:complete